MRAAPPLRFLATALLAALTGCAFADRAVTDVYVGWTTLMNDTLLAVYGPPPGPRDPPAGIEMVFARGSLVYVVDTPAGVVQVRACA